MGVRGLKAAFYADDFTGATDALGQYFRCGLRGLLLFGTDVVEHVEELEGFDVIGVAGVSRSQSGDAFESEVERAFTWLRELGAPVIQYKICSTFDSSPDVGNIGRAVEIAQDTLGVAGVPVIAAQPEFGRYTVFGTHFAECGGRVYRLDRHPTMSRHPVTPMKEADLASHLGEQTSLKSSVVTVNELSLPDDRLASCLSRLLAEPGLVIVDSLDSDHLIKIAGALLSGHSSERLFAVGSGGLSLGIAANLAGFKREADIPDGRAANTAVDQMLVLSGSCSGQTGDQIRYVLRRGWQGIPVDVRKVLSESEAPEYIEELGDAVMAALASGRSVVVYTALGGSGADSDEAMEPSRSAGMPSDHVAQQIGQLFAGVIRSVCRGAKLRRLLIAGGDTSGYTMNSVGAYGLEILGRVITAGFLCRIRSARHDLDRLELMLKGGQVGAESLFEDFRDGRW